MGEIIKLPGMPDPRLSCLPRIHTPEEVAEKYDWDVRALRKLARDGLAPCLRFGRLVRFLDEDVEHIRRQVEPEALRAERLTEIISQGMLRYRTDPRPGFVYFLAYERRVKIGFATDTERRQAEIQHMSPVRLTMMAHYPGTLWEEQALHAHFDKLRLHGEWFRFVDDLENFVWHVPLESERNRSTTPAAVGGVRA